MDFAYVRLEKDFTSYPLCSESMCVDRDADNVRLKIQLKKTDETLRARGDELKNVSDVLALQEARNASLYNKVDYAHEIAQDNYGRLTALHEMTVILCSWQQR